MYSELGISEFFNFALSSSFVDNSINCSCINMDSSVFEVWIGLWAKFYGTFRKGTDLLVTKDFRLLWTPKPFASSNANDISSQKWWITRTNWFHSKFVCLINLNDTMKCNGCQVLPCLYLAQNATEFKTVALTLCFCC